MFRNHRESYYELVLNCIKELGNETPDFQYIKSILIQINNQLRRIARYLPKPDCETTELIKFVHSYSRDTNTKNKFSLESSKENHYTKLQNANYIHSSSIVFRNFINEHNYMGLSIYLINTVITLEEFIGSINTPYHSTIRRLCGESIYNPSHLPTYLETFDQLPLHMKHIVIELLRSVFEKLHFSVDVLCAEEFNSLTGELLYNFSYSFYNDDNGLGIQLCDLLAQLYDEKDLTLDSLITTIQPISALLFRILMHSNISQEAMNTILEITMENHFSVNKEGLFIGNIPLVIYDEFILKRSLYPNFYQEEDELDFYNNQLAAYFENINDLSIEEKHKVVRRIYKMLLEIENKLDELSNSKSCPDKYLDKYRCYLALFNHDRDLSIKHQLLKLDHQVYELLYPSIHATTNTSDKQTLITYELRCHLFNLMLPLAKALHSILTDKDIPKKQARILSKILTDYNLVIENGKFYFGRVELL